MNNKIVIIPEPLYAAIYQFVCAQPYSQVKQLVEAMEQQAQSGNMPEQEAEPSADKKE